MQTISLAEVLHEIRKSGKPFDIEVCECDTTRGTGGALKTYTQALYLVHKDKAAKKPLPVETESTIKRNPNHYANSTLNIFLPLEKKVKKVHVRLITLFNGKQVL